MDGTIATASMLPFAIKYPEFRSWIIAGHMGSEPSHQAAIHALQLKPLLNLDLRLGEGSGAAMASGLMNDALSLLNEMATFESAGVSEK
jgi:nicotinate-nucleotide--dimethylbenzimidazole phosphoribosyltransferase